MPETRDIVLVHGAWQGSWAFDAWLPHLQARGWRTHAVDLPGNGWGPGAAAPASLDTYTDHVCEVLRGLDAPAVVVGHSGGGITASQVAEAMPERVSALVYLAGMMLPSGQSYVDVLQAVAGEHPDLDLSGIARYLDWTADGSATSVREEGALACFVQDCPPDAARHAAALLRPQPETGRAMVNRLGAERFGRVPRFYVECTQDRSVSPLLQQKLQALSPGARRLAIDCGHVPQLAQPRQLTDLLCPWLEALPLAT
jgi:pimeloyl-ACP methyl ester carboxylesterase